jgi:hypothetical protein
MATYEGQRATWLSNASGHARPRPYRAGPARRFREYALRFLSNTFLFLDMPSEATKVGHALTSDGSWYAKRLSTM